MKQSLRYVIMMNMLISVTFGQATSSIIPHPVHLQSNEGYYEINHNTVIWADGDFQKMALQLRPMLEPELGFLCGVHFDE